jgi:hypothetical protein
MTRFLHDYHDFEEPEHILEKLFQLLSIRESSLLALRADRRRKRDSAERKLSEEKTQERWMTLNK